MVSKNQWRWVVLFATAVGTMIADGFFVTSGIYLVAWKDFFKCTAAEVSIIASMQIMIYHIGGLSSGAIVSKVGCRIVGVVGGLMTSLGILLSVFAPSRLMLCLTYGVISGLFCGALFPAHAVAIANYFDKNFSTIRGISSAGSGLGLTLFPPLVQLLTDMYGWQGSLLIVSAIVGNLIVTSLLLRPDDSWETQPVVNGQGNTVLNRGALEISGQSGSLYQPMPGSDDLANDTSRKFNQYRPVSTEENSDPNINSNTSSKTHSTNCEKTNDKSGADCCSPSTAPEVNLVCDYDVTSPLQNNESLTKVDKNKSVCCKVDTNDKGSTTKVKTASSVAANCDIAEVINLDASVKLYNPLHAAFRSVGMSMLAHSFRLSILLFSQFMVGFCYNTVTNHLVAMVILRGIEPQVASFLISFIGIGSTIGRFASGFLVDLGWLSPTNLYMIFMVTCGLAVVVCMASSTYWLYALTCMVAGASSGATFSLEVVLAMQYVGKAHLGKAVGLVLLCHGLGGIVGPVLGGWLYDVTGTYHLTFYVFGGVLALSGFVFLLEPKLRQLEAKKARRILKERAEAKEAFPDSSNMKMMV
ncbi:monocarboxylate transporter 9-like [Diadema setosum]|uniref:monocarboxylate transporter 9-like n=1 Tax=Diadema setosum TaxID=31175 RepID=UPI003B3A99E6